MVLAEDPLGLAQWRGAHRGEPHREVAQLVLRHEQREPKPLLVVLAPHPGPLHRGVGQIDSRANERLDGPVVVLLHDGVVEPGRGVLRVEILCGRQLLAGIR